MTVPAGPYAWLNAEPGPKMLLEALKLYGLAEKRGAGSNPDILAWADELGALGTAYAKWAAVWYNDDAIPWCSLGMAVIAQRANPDDRPERRPPEQFLSARAWSTWGKPVDLQGAMLGDILVRPRIGGNHVCMYVGEDKTHFHAFGFNQDDAANIRRFPKASFDYVRRPAYLNTPANVRKIHLAATGLVSTSEA